MKPATSTYILATRFLIGLCAAICVVPDAAHAITSSHYQIQEDFVGGGGNSRSASPNYLSQDTVGGAVAGDSTSAAYKAQAGAQTTNDPTLAMSLNSSSISLGTLSTSLTRTGTVNFSVLNYTSSGYIVQVLGGPPNNGAHAITNLTSPTAGITGTEQFGINLKSNTLPTVFGAEPLQAPDSTFSFGVAATGYNTANNYKYVAGNTIAGAPKSSGKTTYTISYIINVSNATPGGSYTGSHTLVVTGTY